MLNPLLKPALRLLKHSEEGEVMEEDAANKQLMGIGNRHRFLTKDENLRFQSRRRGQVTKGYIVSIYFLDGLPA